MNELKMPQVGASRSEIVANWQPENPEFWEKFGKKIAKQNLVISTIALTLSFCVWYLWATIAAQLNSAGFNFTTDQLFTLAALPGLVGATLRFVYTYMPALMGGKNWTFVSTLILLVPVVWLGFAVQDTTTSYTTFMILTALIGLAGANFSSSMAYIGNFFPKSEKGTALGINGGVGNLGISVIYFLAPFAMGSAALGNVFGVTPAIIKGNAVYLANAAFMWIVPLVIRMYVPPSKVCIERPSLKKPLMAFGIEQTPGINIASDKSCSLKSKGVDALPFCHQPSMQRSENMAIPSSPAFNGNVTANPPPLGKLTGTSTSGGISAPFPSASCIFTCTASVTVCLLELKLTTLAGSAVCRFSWFCWICWSVAVSGVASDC